MGNCLSSAQGGSRAQRDAASSKQESPATQGRAGRQLPECQVEVSEHMLEAKQEGCKDYEDPSVKPLQQTSPPMVDRLAYSDSAEENSGRWGNNAEDSASDWVFLSSKHGSAQSKDCKTQGGVHDTLASGPPVCANEAGRIETFLAFGLDKPVDPCPELDFVLQAVCRVFGAPYASLSLYHNKTCVVCNTVGFQGGGVAWPLCSCPWNLLVSTPTAIACGDLLEDARFADQPWTQSGLRTFCSAPLMASNGERLGSCCFMDFMPRKVDAGMCRLLNNFGEIAVRVLERHIGLAVRLAEARQNARQLPDKTAYHAQPLLESVRVLDNCTYEINHHHHHHHHQPQQQQQQQQELAKRKSSDKMGIVPVVKGGGWAQQLQGAGPQAEAAAVAAACQSYGVWWGDEASSAAAASTAAAAAVARSEGRAGVEGDKCGALQPACSPQQQLCKVFQREVRDTARTADACVLLVDTGHPDWPVIYADDTWKEWAGYSRDATLGRGLFELLQPAAPSVAPWRREQLQAEAQTGVRFVLHGQVAVPPSNSEADLARAMSAAGSVISLPTLHTNVPAATSTQMGQESASDCVLQSVNSNVVLGQPKRGCSSILDTLSSNATALQRRETLVSHKEDSSTSIDWLRQHLPQHEHGRQSTDLNSTVAPSPFHRPSCILRNSIGGVLHAPSAAATPSCHEEQPKSTDYLLGTHMRIKSDNPLASASLWNASHSAETLAPPPANQASNRKSPGSAVGADKANKPSRVFDLSFRPAALDVLDCDALPLGVPSFVPMETTGRMLSLYMVRLHKRGEEVVQPASKPFEPSAKVTEVGQANPTLLAPRFFPGMRVQQVLGVGGYGTAYQGQWHDTKVVLKVQDYMLSSTKELLEAQLEVILGQLLNHPNLVHTLAHATVELPPNSLVPLSQVKQQASQKQKASKARAAYKKRSSLGSPAVPCRLSFQGPRRTQTTDPSAVQRAPSAAHEALPGPSCVAAPSDIAATRDTSARSSEGSTTKAPSQKGEPSAAPSPSPSPAPMNSGERRSGEVDAAASGAGEGASGHGGEAGVKMGSRGSDRKTLSPLSTLADDFSLHEEGQAGDEGEELRERGVKKRESELGGQLCDELHEDDVLLNDDPAYWFSNADANVHRLPAMLTSLGHSLNLDLSTLLDNALNSITSLSRHSFIAGSSAQVPSTVPPALPTVSSVDSNATSPQDSNNGRPTGASNATVTSPHPSQLEFDATAGFNTEGGASGGSSSCAAISTLVSRKTGKPSASSAVQTMGDETEDKQGNKCGGPAGVAHKPSPFSAVQALSGVGGGGGHRDTSLPSSHGGQQKVDAQQETTPSVTAVPNAVNNLSWGSNIQGTHKNVLGSSVEGSMGAQIEQLLADAEARAQEHKNKALSFPMCVRTLTMMDLCDGGSLLDAIDRGWLRDGPCSVFTPVDIVKVVHVALDIASALEYLHSVGVVHADLSAGNVLLTRLPPGVKRNTGVTSASHSSNMQQQQQVANPLFSSPATATATAGASPFAAAAHSTAATAPMPTVPECVPLTPEIEEEGRGCVDKMTSFQRAASCPSGVSAGDIGSAPGTTGYDFVAERRGQIKGDNVADSCLADLPVASDGVKFATTPPVRRYSLGNTTPTSARDMQFVAKVCDYGKARLLSPSGIVKAQAYATITHMSPEVLTDLLLSPAADMYAFGVLLWQMVCCSRPWPMMSHQQIFAVVSCNSAQLPWPNTTPISRPSGIQARRAASTPAPGIGAGGTAHNAEVVDASGAAHGARGSHAADPQTTDASTDVPVLGGAPAEVAAAAGACTAVPPELVELGKACLAHDMHARPSAATAVATLRSFLARMKAA